MAAPKSVEDLIKGVRVSGGWGFGIAGVTGLNAVVAATGSEWSLLLGSVIAVGAMQVAAQSGPLAQGLALVVNLMTIAFFVVMAIYARRGKAWAFVLMFVAYLLDTLVLLVEPHPVAIGLHLWVLYSLFVGFGCARAWRKIREAPTAHPFPPELAGSLPVAVSAAPIAPPPLEPPPSAG